jgi:hypothetical protein
MGANATTFVPAYVSGEVLTAADLTVTNSGIPVFADSTARDNGFGGTGEKALAEGQFAYIEATNTTQYYDGAAWQSVGVAPGLVLITTATASAVSSLSINDCFSSTYAAYEIEIINTTNVGPNARFTARLRVSGTDTTTNYTDQRLGAYSTNVFADANTTGTDEWYVADLDPTYKGYFTKMTLHNPNAATFTTCRTATNFFNSTASLHVVNIAAQQEQTTQFTGITFLTSGTSFTGTIRVYGYANS